MDKKEYKLCQSINLGSFPGICSLSIGYTYDELIDQYKEWGSTGWAEAISMDKELIDDSTWIAMVRIVERPGEKDTHYYFIIIKEWFDFSDNAYTYLAHEVHHVVTFALGDALNLAREYEAAAYTHTHVMRQILEAIRTVEEEGLKKEKSDSRAERPWPPIHVLYPNYNRVSKNSYMY